MEISVGVLLESGVPKGGGGTVSGAQQGGGPESGVDKSAVADGGIEDETGFGDPKYVDSK